MRKQSVDKILLSISENYEKIAEQFSFSRQRLWPEVIDLANAYLKNGDDVLDAGCGNGRLYDCCLKEKNIHYFGFDQSKNFINHCQKKFKDEKNCHFLVDNLLSFDFGKQKFDAIFCLATFNHLPDKSTQRKVLEKFFQVLKPNGLLIMTNWNLWKFSFEEKTLWNFWWKNILKSAKKFKLQYLMDKNDLSWREMITLWGKKQDPGRLYYYAFTLNQLAKMFKDSGFFVVKKYYAKNGEKVNCFTGNNLVIVAKRGNF